MPLGELGRTFQLEGALRWRVPERLQAAEAPPATGVAARAVTAAGRLFVAGLGSVRVREVRFQGAAGPLLLLEGVRDRTAAQRLVNAGVWLDPTLLPAELAAELNEAATAKDDEEAIIGLEVRLGDAVVGTVTDADLTGRNAVVVVALRAGGDCLVPLAAPYVALTDEPALVLTDPPPGLLDPG